MICELFAPNYNPGMCNVKKIRAIFISKTPYKVIGGVTIFSSRFLELLLISFDTDLTDGMSDKEQVLYNNFVNYEDGLYTDNYVIDLDEYLKTLL